MEDLSSSLGNRLVVTSLNALSTDFKYGEYLLKMPAGTGPEGGPLINGRVCVSPFDTGDSPNCDSYPLGTKLNNNKTRSRANSCPMTTMEILWGPKLACRARNQMTRHQITARLGQILMASFLAMVSATMLCSL